jgi:hypothetical protein
MIKSLLSIENNCFPDKLKEAQVTPIFKKSDPLMKTNYRPVSVLPIFSKKKNEKVYEIQLSEYFDKIFNPFVCAFRRRHESQTTLLGLLEDWREALAEWGDTPYADNLSSKILWYKAVKSLRKIHKYRCNVLIFVKGFTPVFQQSE